MIISYENAKKEIARLTIESEKLRNELKRCPQGDICCARNMTSYKWYVIHERGRNYLPKINESLAKKLALKKYMTLKLIELESEIKGLERYCSSIKKACGSKCTSETLLAHEEYSKLLNDFFRNNDEVIQKWTNEEYEKCNKNPENLTIKGTEGKLLRSKSEALIDLMLYTNKIPFRYESKLVLNGITLFPDFTIFNPKTKTLILWEHFGMMDDPLYVDKTYEKLKLYSKNGYIPDVNLIVTFETADNPLSTETVREKIEKIIGWN
ncbi:MAG: hypothetical protein MJZ11_13815 [Lachnospiraceae bacterium]|nr:hypothetical protein [Lachnospiraceae bacterium]